MATCLVLLAACFHMACRHAQLLPPFNRQIGPLVSRKLKVLHLAFWIVSPRAVTFLILLPAHRSLAPTDNTPMSNSHKVVI
jgi:hypothetical protein